MKTKAEVALDYPADVCRWFFITQGVFENLKFSMFFLVISFVYMQITDRFWNHYDNSLQFLDKLMG